MKPNELKGNAIIVIGGKWGDEGKGKITSRFSKDADLVIRGTGGANAGHTIVFNGKKIALHLVPGGIVYPKPICLIGQGVVIDIPVLIKEIQTLEEMGVPNVRERLRITGRAHIVLPYHKELDGLYEKFKENHKNMDIPLNEVLDIRKHLISNVKQAQTNKSKLEKLHKKSKD